jgi:hypothetical protein
MNRKEIAIIVALCLSLFLVIGVPFIFSAVTGVPLSFLLPIHLLSLAPSKGVMSVKINTTAPTTVGESLLVTVLDAGNNNTIEGATVKVMFNGDSYCNKTTSSDGTTEFPYAGATTIVYVSKDGYQDADPIPLPQVPESWVTTRDYLLITLAFGLLGSWGPALFLSRKQQAKLPSRKKKK